MRELIFSDPGRRQRLESILHPVILEELQKISAQAGGPYQLLVIPLLVESGLEGSVDRVLVVDAPPALQLERLLERDRENPSQAHAMIAAQTQRQTRLAHADDVITNDGTMAKLEAQVDELHQRYLRLATEQRTR